MSAVLCRAALLVANRNSSFKNILSVSRNVIKKRNLHISLTKVIQVQRSAERCCSVSTGAIQKRFITGLSQRSFCQQEKERWTDLSYEQLNALIESRDIILIDVREQKEIEALGKISESINIPLGQVKEALALAPDKFEKSYGKNLDEEKIVFHCQAGVRSMKAIMIARELGFDKARHFPGGFEEWSKRQKGGHKKASASGS